MRKLICILILLSVSCTKKTEERNIQIESEKKQLIESEKKSDPEVEVTKINPEDKTKVDQAELPVAKQETNSVITVPAVKPDSLPSLEQFKKEHPEVKVKIEKLDKNQMNPNAVQSMEEFKKSHPDVKVEIKKLDNKQMIPMH